MAIKPTQFYKNNFPKEGEIVRIVMTQLNTTAVDCFLPDYANKLGIILLADLSNRKRYKKGRGTIRKFFYPGKTICAKVTTSDITKNSIVLTRRYQDEWKSKAKMILAGNNRLITMVNTITRKLYNEFSQDDLDLTWNEIIHPIDSMIPSIDEQITIYDYIEKNKDKLNIPDKYKDLFLDAMDKYTKKVQKKYNSRFGLISMEGIDYTKKIFDKLVNELNIEINNILYDGESGYWKLITTHNQPEDAEKTHNEFIERMKVLTDNTDKFHLKTDYIGQTKS